MIQLKYDASLMKYFSVFEDTTKVTVKDCFYSNDRLIFFVPKGKAKIAVGKQGSNVKKLKDLLNKDIKVVEFSKDPLDLVRNTVFPLKPKKIEFNEDKSIINISFKSFRERRQLLDNNQEKLNLVKEIVKRHHKDIKDVRVLQI